MAMGKLGQLCCGALLGLRFSPVFLVCRQLRQLQSGLRLPWCGRRVHDLDLAVGGYRASRC